MTVERATALVRKWQPSFGLGDFRITVRELTLNDIAAWAYSFYQVDEMWGLIEIPGDGELPDQLQELLVCHELAHGLLELASHDGALEEQACNRIARIATRDWNTPLADETIWHSIGDEFFEKADKHHYPLAGPRPGPKSAPIDRHDWLPIVADALPDAEREVVAAIYWDGRSLRDIAAERGVSHLTVKRLRDSALQRLARYFAALDKHDFHTASRKLITLRQPEGGAEHEVIYLLHHRCSQASALVGNVPDEDLDLLVFPVGNYGYSMPRGVPFTCTATDPCGACGRLLTTWFVWQAGAQEHPGEIWTP